MASPSQSRTPRPTDADNMVATVAVTTLSVVTAVAMCRVFNDWRFLSTLLTMVVVIHAVSTLLRIARVPGLIAIPIVLIVMIEVLALLFYSDTLRLALPTGDTLNLLRLDLRLVWSQFPSAVAPVPSVGSFLLAASVGLGLVSMFADAFAFRAFGRGEAVVPAGVLFIFTAALGTDRNRVTVAAVWFAAALAVVAILRALHSGGTDSWLGRRRRAVGAALPATAMCALVAALGAAVLGPMLPGAGAEPLLDARNGGGDVTNVLNPFVDIRSRIINQSRSEMFTVSATAGRNWRVAAMSKFDGSSWTLPDSELESATGELNQARGVLVQQQIQVSRMRGNLVPSAFTPVRAAQQDLRWLPQSDTLVLAGESMAEGDVFNIAADISLPSVEQLRAATASSPPGSEFFDLPSDIPSEVVDAALAATAGARSPYEQALALQNWFRSDFDYDLTVQKGHSDDAIVSFLRVRRGYCEQFSGTFAVMARILGLPSRVAVGYTKGELRADGKYHVFGRNAHAWPEVWFDGVGWVAFEPTPGRGAPGAEAITGVAEAQDTTVPAASTGDRGDRSAPTTSIARVTPTTEPNRGDGPSAPTTAPSFVGTSGGGGGSGRAGWIALGLAAAAVWILAMPSLVRRFTPRGVSPNDRVVTAWQGALGALQLAGAPSPSGSTPIEYAIRVEQEIGVDSRSILELARFTTRAIYSPAGVGEPAALRAAVLRTHLDETSRTLMPWQTRLWSRVDPRLVRQRLIGVRPGVDRRAM